MTAVYVTELPPLFNWAHSILAALIVLTDLQKCCLPFVHNCLYFLALALFILCVLVNIMSVQSYSTALIWVNPQCTLIFVYQAFMSLNSCYMARHLVFSRHTNTQNSKEKSTSRLRPLIYLLLFDSYRFDILSYLSGNIWHLALS